MRSKSSLDKVRAHPKRRRLGPFGFACWRCASPAFPYAERNQDFIEAVSDRAGVTRGELWNVARGRITLETVVSTAFFKGTVSIGQLPLPSVPSLAIPAALALSAPRQTERWQ